MLYCLAAQLLHSDVQTLVLRPGGRMGLAMMISTVGLHMGAVRPV